MAINRVFSGAPWEEKVGYCRALRTGSYIHVAGTTAVDREGKIQHPGDAYGQTRSILEKISGALHQLGADMSSVVRTRMYVVHIEDWEQVTRAHGEFFQSVRPVSTLVGVSALINPEMLVEIEVDAFVSEAETFEVI